MGMPAVLTVNGQTTSAIWIPDWMQPFFQVGIGVVGTSGLGTATLANIQATYDDPNNVANPNWFTIGTAVAAATVVPLTFTSPCQGFRLSIATADATTTFAATFVQATFGR